MLPSWVWILLIIEELFYATDEWTADGHVVRRCRWTDMAALHYATYFDVAPVLSKLLHKTKVSWAGSFRRTLQRYKPAQRSSRTETPGYIGWTRFQST
jgi:hypothetical protein